MSAKCGRCGKPLKDPYSIAIGMGPECRKSLKKKGWRFPTPHYEARGDKVVLVGMTGKIKPPGPTGDLSIKSKKRKVKHADN
jgi:hypothetical protein